MTKTPTSLPDRLDAARAELQHLQELDDRINTAGSNARNEATTAYYQRVANEMAREAGEHRDQADNRLNQIALADKPTWDEMWSAYLDRSTEDAVCGAMSVVASAIQKHELHNERGVYPMPSRAAAVDEEYRGMSFAQFVDQVVARRADAIRGREIERLRAEATAAGEAAEAAARAAAAGGSD